MTEPTVEELLSVISADTDHRPNTNMLPRPEGMSRQQQRRAYRIACALSNVVPTFTRPTDKKERRKMRKQHARLRNDQVSRHQNNLNRRARHELQHIFTAIAD